MEIKLLINNLIYDGTKYKKGDLVKVDEITGLRLIKYKFATIEEKPTIVDKMIKEPTKKAIRKSTRKNG